MSFICAGVNSLVRMILMSLDVLAFDAGLHGADVLLGRAVARFATDARLGPGRVVGVGRQVVVRREFASRGS